jgi:hypothetical protein
MSFLLVATALAAQPLAERALRNANLDFRALGASILQSLAV